MHETSMGRPLRYFAAETGGSGGDALDISQYHNPENVLAIRPRLTAVTLDLGEGRKPLPTQFDELLSPKDTYLEYREETAKEMGEVEESLRQSLRSLRNEAFHTFFIDPILQKLTELKTKLPGMIGAKDSHTFDALAESLGMEPEKLRLLEKRLFAKLFSWSGSQVADMEREVSEGFEKLGYTVEEFLSAEHQVEDMDLQVEALLESIGGERSPDTDEQSRPSELDIEVRRAFASIVFHRLGNLDPVSTRIQTFFNVGDFHDFADDRKEILPHLEARENHLKFMGLFLEFAHQARFAPIVEWAQHRIHKLPNGR